MEIQGQRVILEHLVRMVLPELMVPKVNKDHKEKMVLQEALEMMEQMVLREKQVLPDNQVLKVQMENPATLEQREHQVIKDQMERKDQMEIREHRENLEMQDTRALKVELVEKDIQVYLDLTGLRDNLVKTPIKELVKEIVGKLESLENQEIKHLKVKKDLT